MYVHYPMSDSTSRLAPLVSAMADDLRAKAQDPSAHAGLLGPLHVLILTSILRLLTRLVDLVRLWEAGLLPPPTPRHRPARIRAAARATPNVATPYAASPRRRSLLRPLPRALSAAIAAAPARARASILHAPRPARGQRNGAAPRPDPGHPTPTCREKRLLASAPSHAYNVTVA